MKISDITSCLLPGKRFNVTFTAKIDHGLAKEIISKYKNNPSIRKVLFDTIIMHIEEGSDLFLTIFFELSPSCFGTSFEQLSKISKPLSKCRLSDIEETPEEEEVIFRRKIRMSIFSMEPSSNPSVNRTIPIEIFRLIDYLHKNQRQTKQIFASYNTGTEIDDVARNKIRDYLDSWSLGPFPGTPTAALGVLLKIFDLSPLPLLTISDQDITATYYKYDLSKDLIMKNPPLHRRIFLYLCLFIQEMRMGQGNDRSMDLNIGKNFKCKSL